MTGFLCAAVLAAPLSAVAQTYPAKQIRFVVPYTPGGATDIVAHPSMPVRTVRELITLARARPGALSYATTGNGGPHHLGAELFSRMAGVKMLHVPYKGASVVASSPEAFAAYMKSEVAKWAKVVRDAGIRLE